MKKTIVLTALLTCLLTFSANAAPACSEPTEYTQPNGSVIELYTYGDEHFSFTGDSEGYMLVRNDNGQYVYVTQGKSRGTAPAEGDRPLNAVMGFDMRPESEAVSEIVSPSMITIADNITKCTDTPMVYSSPSIAMMSTADDGAAEEEPEFVPASSAKVTPMLILAVDFTDEKISDTYYSAEEITKKFFSMNSDSVNTYYNEVSDGLQTFSPAFVLDNNAPDVDEYGYGKIGNGIIKLNLDINRPATYADSNSGYYEENKAVVDNNIEYIAANAIWSANDILDFTQYNKNNDKFLGADELVICFIIAGYDASGCAEGNYNRAVWAHSGSIPAVKCDGLEFVDDVYVDRQFIKLDERYTLVSDLGLTTPTRYAMLGAMRADDEPMQVGTFCHEIFHVLGGHDLYNTNNSKLDFDYSKIDAFSLMAKGNWCRKPGKDEEGRYLYYGGTSPTHIDPWSKLSLGWFKNGELKEIGYNSEEVNTEVLTALAAAEGVKYLKVNTKASDVYYLIENRGIAGFDVGLTVDDGDYEPVSEGGIAIWRIDNAVVNDTSYDGAKVTYSHTYEEVEMDDCNHVFYNVVHAFDMYYTRADMNIINTTPTPGVKLIRYSEMADGTMDLTKSALWGDGIAFNDVASGTTHSAKLNTPSTSRSGVKMSFANSENGITTSVKSGVLTSVQNDGISITNNSGSDIELIPFKGIGDGFEQLDDTIQVEDGHNGTVLNTSFNGADKVMLVEKGGDNTAIYIHNNTLSPFNFNPVVRDAEGGVLEALPAVSVKEGEIKGTSLGKPVINDGNSYKIFTFDFKTMKPMMKAAEIDLTE